MFVPIITDEEVRKIRAIAPHLNSERLEPYIEEAVSLVVIPTLTAAIYKEVSETQERYESVLNGGFFQRGSGGNEQLFYVNGLKKAVAYLAYSRFLLSQQVTVTSFGVSFKNGELSERVDDKTLQYLSNSAREVGMQYLAEVQKVLCKDTTALTKRRAKISIIGGHCSTGSSHAVVQVHNGGEGITERCGWIPIQIDT